MTDEAAEGPDALHEKRARTDAFPWYYDR